MYYQVNLCEYVNLSVVVAKFPPYSVRGAVQWGRPKELIGLTHSVHRVCTFFTPGGNLLKAVLEGVNCSQGLQWPNIKSLPVSQ